ncbi:GDSL esterase/lipase 2 [Neltuma alba]|uniref:GDSL esterase/lipase 2 n=1 Tax=Neltuma alba TaxID=207710 RepID=UPI0010A3847F|nr:GDSL esterase/lipase 2-like [Prosopis alba]
MASLRMIYAYLSVFLMSIANQITNCSGNRCLLHEKEASLFVFGDSLFDAGINNYLSPSFPANKANYPPYGQTFFNYPSGRFSDGRIIPDFIAEYAKLPLILPYLHPDSEHYYVYGINFASAGAGALVETSPPEYVLDLNTQVSYYKNVSNVLRKKLGNAEAKAFFSKAVHLVSIGANDYGARFGSNSSVFLRYSQQQFIDIVIGNLTTAIKEIHTIGGRKFGFVNVGPAGCSPGAKMIVNGTKGACDEKLLEVARIHNDEFSRMLLKLEKQLDGFKYSVFDFYDSALQVMKYPSKYGFKEGSVACCGGGPYRGDNSCGGKRGIKKYKLCKNVSEYLFFDSAHPTDKANQLLSQLMWSGNLTVNKPYNLRQLFRF